MGKLQKRKGNNAVAFEKGNSPLQYNQYATLSEQGKSCQMFRGVIQSHCITLDSIKDKIQIQQLCITLLNLYLTPVVFPVRKILEWIVDIVVRKCCMGLIDSNELQACIKLVFHDFKKQFDSDMSQTTIRSDTYYMEWVMTFNNLVSLERESPWLHSVSDSVLDTSVYGYNLTQTQVHAIFDENFYSLLHYDGLIIKKLSTIVLSNSTSKSKSNPSDSQENPGGVSVSLLACYEESVRLIASAVKCKKLELLKGTLVLDAECSIFDPATLRDLDTISKLAYVTQNVVNGITLCIASINWVYNTNNTDNTDNATNTTNVTY